MFGSAQIHVTKSPNSNSSCRQSSLRAHQNDFVQSVREVAREPQLTMKTMSDNKETSHLVICCISSKKTALTNFSCPSAAATKWKKTARGPSCHHTDRWTSNLRSLSVETLYDDSTPAIITTSLIITYTELPPKVCLMELIVSSLNAFCPLDGLLLLLPISLNNLSTWLPCTIHFRNHVPLLSLCANNSTPLVATDVVDPSKIFSLVFSQQSPFEWDQSKNLIIIVFLSETIRIGDGQYHWIGACPLMDWDCALLSFSSTGVLVLMTSRQVIRSPLIIFWALVSYIYPYMPGFYCACLLSHQIRDRDRLNFNPTMRRLTTWICLPSGSSRHVIGTNWMQV